MNILILTNNLKYTQKFSEILNNQLSRYNICIEVFDFQYVIKEIPKYIIEKYDFVFMLSYIIKSSSSQGYIELRYKNTLKETPVEMLSRSISRIIFNEFIKDKNFLHHVSITRDPNFPDKLGENTLSVKIYSKLREEKDNEPFIEEISSIITDSLTSLPRVCNNVHKLYSLNEPCKNFIKSPIIKDYLNFEQEIIEVASKADYNFDNKEKQSGIQNEEIATVRYSIEYNEQEQTELVSSEKTDDVNGTNAALEKMNIIVDGHFIESKDLPVNIKRLQIVIEQYITYNSDRYSNNRWLLVQNATTREILIDISICGEEVDSFIKKEIIKDIDTTKYKSSKIVAIVNGIAQKAVYNNITKGINAVSNGYKNKEVMLQSVEDNEIVFYK